MKLLNTLIDNKYLAIPLLFLLTFLLSFTQVLGLVLQAFIEFVMPSGFVASDLWVTGRMYFAFIGTWIGVYLYLRFTKKNRPILRVIGSEPKGNRLKFVLLGLLLGFGMNFFVAFVAMMNKDIHITFESFEILPLLFLLLVVFIQCSAEELTDRVFLYQRLRRVYKSPRIAIVTSALLFSLMHVFNSGVTILSLVNIFLIGLFYALVVYYFDSVWFCFMHHTAWNFTQNIILGLPNSGNVLPYSIFKLDTASASDSFTYSKSFGIEGTVLTCIMFVVSIAIVIYLGRKKNQESLNIWIVESQEIEKEVKTSEEIVKPVKTKSEKSRLQHVLSYSQWAGFLLLFCSQWLVGMFGLGTLASIIVYIVGVIIILLLGKRKKLNLRAILPYRIKPSLIQIGLVIILFLTAGPVATLIHRLSVCVFPDTISSSMSEMNTIISLIYMALFGPIFEEVIFRGLVFGGIRRTKRVALAIVASSILFGAVHANFSQVFYTTFMGFVFAIEREKTGSMWIPTIHHILNNSTDAITLVINRFAPDRSKLTYLWNLNFDPQSGTFVFEIVFTIVCAIIMAFCLLKLLKPTEEAILHQQELDEKNDILISEATVDGKKLHVLTTPYWINLILFIMIAITLAIKGI